MRSESDQRLRTRFDRWIIVSILATLACGLSVADVSWRNGAGAALREMNEGELESALERLAARPSQRKVVIRLDVPLDATRRQVLEMHGVRLLSYLGDGTYFATLAADLDAAGASTISGLVHVGPVATRNKLHPDLARGAVHPWSVVEPRPKTGDPIVAAYVLFHRDVDLTGEAPAILARHEAKVRSFMRSINGVVAHLPANRIESLAGEDAVMYVEPPLPRLSEINDSNRAIMGTETVNDPPYGLDGSGVTVLVYDGGQMFAHGDFTGRLTVGSSDTSGISDHATHVGGTIGGDGSGSTGQYRGMAPAVDFISFGFEQEGGLTEGFLYTDPGDLEADYTEAITVYGADLSNNSIGSNTAPNGFPCEWEGNYGATGALIDAIARGSIGEPFRIVWANGNERGSGRCGTTYLTTAPPACAKNHITVGAMNSNDDSVTDFTSWGPTDDGRIKPDISGPGCESGGDGGVTSTNSSGGYNVKCGTSMASPSVAGVSALLLQQYRLSYPGAPDFRNSTLKAILANSAQDLEAVGPDYMTGYGSVRAVPATDTIIEGRLLEAEVAQGEIYSFLVVVGPGDSELKVTLAWDDPPGTPNVNPVLVNDLDLRVIDGGSTVHFPWTLDPANPANPAVRTQRDGANNIEQVVIDTPAPGAYLVEVEGFNVADGPTQTFSVAASPSLINCTSAGILAASRGRIACDDTLELRVTDCDLNTDDAVIETVTVDVVSGSEPTGEPVLLTETVPESATFLGALPVSTVDSAGTLLVAEGETITATYVDADDGEGGVNVSVTRDVIVDCTAPVITAVSMTEIQPRDATTSIDVDEPARLTVLYGTTCGSPTDSAISFGLNTAHSVKLKNLVDDTTYFFHVVAEDEAGNASIDDNGGACYTFATPEIPDFFTEQFSTGIDLVGSMATFVPNGSIDFYTSCIEPLAGGLPTDPAGGTDLGLSDDQPASFTLTGGQMVSLYGQSYDTIHVGPNGYVTFGSGDSTYNESLSQHFALPRVAARFDDLNPSSAGSVSWLQLGDRVAVSWEGVPEYSTSNSNTFQIELFFDGQIRMSWLQIDGSDGITGLSSGAGLDPDFFETDLSEGPSCGPRPPAAQGATVQTEIGQPVGISLTATDDGLPEPPSLTYRIVGLPVAGTLIDDATSATIVVVPHDLNGGGNSVTYVPASGFQGGDSFTFAADDGGLPPDGGVSSAATINVTVGGPQVIHEFLVDDSDPGWTTTGDWAFGVPLGGGSHALDPTGGATGLNVYGYNLAGDYPDGMGLEYLTSLPIDLGGAIDTSIEFQRWLGVESSTYDHATVEISTDGMNWTTVWDHSGGAISESAWSLQSYDISAVADDQTSVSFRWIMGGTDGSVTYPGWNLDDIRIRGVVPLTSDCDPGDPDVWRVPQEVLNLHVDGVTSTTLSWNDQAALTGPGTSYDLVSGPISVAGIDFGPATCLQSSTSSSHVDVRPDPAPSSGYWYLTRAWNSCGGAGFGETVRDAAIPDGDGDGQTDVCEP